MPAGYLIDIPEREHEAIRRFVKLFFLHERFWGSLGLVPGFSWYVLEVRTHVHFGLPQTDIDILAGRLAWSDSKAFEICVAEEKRERKEHHPGWHYNFAALRLAGAGGIQWPPPTKYLVGIEAKCAYYAPPKIKSDKSSTKKSRGIRSQIDGLLRMGLNRVALLEFIANPPATRGGSQAWFEAAHTAAMSMDAMRPTLAERLPTNSSSGHWVCPIGSIFGGDETKQGATSLIELQTAQDNLLLQVDMEVQARRVKIEEKLGAILSNCSRPLGFPVILLDCKRCRTIHGFEDSCR